MAKVSDLRRGLAANLASLPDTQVSAYLLANPTPPTVQIAPGDPLIDYDAAFHRGLDTWYFVVQSFVPYAQDEAAQIKLDATLDAEGATSIKDLIEADRTLGGKAQDLRVTSCSGYQLLVGEGRGQMLMCEWSVEVLATSS